MYGSETSGNFGSLDIMIVPCHFKETVMGGKVDKIPPNCNRDKDKFIDYIGHAAVNLVSYYNTKEFRSDEYGQEKL